MLYDIIMIIFQCSTRAGLLLICIIMILQLWTRFPLSSGTDTGGSGFASVLLRYPSTIWLQWTRQQPTVTHLVQFILKRCPLVFWDTSGAVLMIYAYIFVISYSIHWPFLYFDKKYVFLKLVGALQLLYSVFIGSCRCCMDSHYHLILLCL